MEVEKNEKWQAGGGTTALGIIGTTLGGLATVAGGTSLFGGNGIFGGNNANATGAVMRENSELRSEIAQLKSEKYTDTNVLAMSKELSAVDERLHAVDDKLATAIAQNKADITAMKELVGKDLEIAKQQSKIDSLQLEARLGARIDAVAVTASQGIQANGSAIACLQNLVNGITKAYVPQTAIVANNCCNGCATTCCAGNQ